MIKVNVFLPEDTTALQDKLADVVSDILIRKLNKDEVEKLINVLETTDILQH
ncbi:hypothetical protein [Clostridium culturomicium]|uniref:hypothetical protein n=1 Tax=Clostridium culturomicium TaxID=1499683 RepID=UPI003857F359